MTSRFAQSATDVEAGSSSSSGGIKRIQQPRRLKRRLTGTLLARVALSSACVFFVFLLLGMLRANGPRNTDASKWSRGSSVDTTNTGQPSLFTFSIVAEYDHDPAAFTQGFEMYRDQDQSSAKEHTRAPELPKFIESTGLRGQSTVREVDLATGKVLRLTKLLDQDFGEGITQMGHKLYQVTWQGSKMIIYNAEDFSVEKVLSTHLKDGWGITNDGDNLIVGDSTHSLYYIDPDTTKMIKKIDVTDNGRPITWLNELEWVDGLIYANIWQTECIAQIEPNTGNVVGWVDLSGITDMVKVHSPDKRVDVLNGIAWDEVEGKLYITGKRWPKVYEIQLRPLYVDSKKTNVDVMTESIRRRCIIHV
jgi:glutamine cyclotransferase